MVFERVKKHFKKDEPTNNAVKIRKIERIDGNIVDDFFNTIERGNNNE